MADYGILLSKEPQDEECARKACASAALEVFRALDAKALRRIITKESLVFWNLDAQEPPQISIGQLLQDCITSGQVFSFGAKPLNEYSYVLKMRAIGHYYRHGVPSGAGVFEKVLALSLAKEPLGMEKLLPAGTAVKKISITKSKDRGIATEAVSNVLTQKAVPPRLAQTMGQCVDELLMNALFDAPVERGNHYRMTQDRAANYDLSQKEVVDLQMASTPEMIFVTVTDHFGSISRENVLSYLARDYERVDYRPRQGESAGLGIYGIVDSGISISYVVKPGVATQATLILPLVSGIKEFRKAFRLFSFIQR